MKTIFDTLTLPEFRKQPGLYIGGRDLQTLETWMGGYIYACMDAKKKGRLDTPNGLPIFLLRDYIAFREKDRSVGGIAYILTAASNGRNEEAWGKFFSHLDDFMGLEIISVQRLQVTDEMKCFAASQHKSYEFENSKMIPRFFNTNTIVKRNLSNGLCWMAEETDHGERMLPESDYSVLSEDEADEIIMGIFGAVNWEG